MNNTTIGRTSEVASNSRSIINISHRTTGERRSSATVKNHPQDMESVTRAYNHVFYERADPRVKDWFFMTSPIPMVVTCFGYLLTIKLIIPLYMRNRKAYRLKTFIKWYNIVQIVANAVVTWGIATSGWTTTYHFGCMLPDYSADPQALRMLRFMWWTVVLKLLELAETGVFLLRRRRRQASFLHVYHHVSSVAIVWIAVKYVGGGISSFSPLVNNATHVLMYSYYLAAAEGGPKIRAVLNKYKKWLTIIQMVQFTIMIVYTSQVFLPSCPAPLGVTPFYFANVMFVYYMFYNFYKQNYKKKSHKNGSHSKLR